MQVFLPGQRWLSDAQSDLGLGQVTAVDERCVHILFPATGEQRLYARRDAPLSRVELDAGERIKDLDGLELTVTGRCDTDGLISYQCEDLEGAPVVVPETRLDPHLHLNRPRQRLLAGRIDKDAWFNLRYQTRLQAMRGALSPVRGLAGARVSLIPHQLYIAAEVAARDAPRVLLADEVGLGKTIEAGLILRRLLLTGRASRVLVVVPEPLLHQWLVEMLRRFNMRFALFDRERFHADGTYNPFQSEQRVLCSLEFLTGSPDVARAALEGQWDLMVVDEAHHLTWSEDGSSLEYDLIEALAGQVSGVLLLTATPEQLGRAGHFARLRLLDPHRFYDYAAFVEEEAAYAPIARIAAALLDGQPLDAAATALVAGLIGDAEGLSAHDIIERLVDRHGTGRILFRNTRSAVQGFPERALMPHPLPRPDAYQARSDDALDGLYPERLFGRGWTDIDPRLDWLAQTLRQLRPDRVLVICSQAETVLDLRRALLEREGIHAAVFHEGMEIVERDRAAAYFAAMEDGTQILICSEIGSEGRNFQFAHHLVLFDLPLEPDLLEQRIGRLDRIGQLHVVQIHVPYLKDSPGAVLYRWYAEGLDAFEANCPAAQAVAAQLHGQLLEALADSRLADALIAEAKGLVSRFNADLEAGRDRLLELHSHRADLSSALVEAIHVEDADLSLPKYFERFWDAFGVDHEPGSGASIVVHPGRYMLHEQFPGLPEGGTTVTFHRSDALSHEDREFLTWEHPMTRGAMDMLTSSDLGASAATVIMRDERFKPGTVLLEMVHIAECPAPPELEIERFLPPTALRLLLDVDGKDLSDSHDTASLSGSCLTRNRKLAKAVIASQADKLNQMLAAGEQRAQRAVTTLKKRATQRMGQTLGDEIERLRALALVNPSVRPDEIEHLEARRLLLDRHLARIHLRLDALRVIVFG